MTDAAAITEFLYTEADLLDRADLDTWMTLFTDDGWYWLPASVDQPDPINHVSHIYDDRVMMEIRRRTFVHPRASSKDWVIRCSHLIGKVRVAPAAEDGGITVTSTQHVAVWYRDEQRLYACRVTHVLEAQGDNLLIRSKTVELLNPESPQRSLIIYL